MPSRYAGSNHPELGRNNRARVFRAIHELGPVARVDLARATGLNDKTITNIVNDLLAHGLATEAGFRPSRGAGRPATELVVRPAARYAVGIDLTRSAATCALVDLSGTVHQRVTTPAPTPWRGDQIIPVARQAWDRLSETIKPAQRQHIVGIGIGAPNPLRRHDSQYQTFDSGAGQWHDLASMRDLERTFGFPVHADQNANTSALAELWFGAGQRVDTFALLNLGPGLGASLVINGRLHHGAHDSAGEVAHLPVDMSIAPDPSGANTVGEQVSMPAVLDAVVAALAAGEQSVLSALDKVTIGDVIAALKSGDELAVRVFADVARYLGAVIAAIVRIVDPQLVVIGRDIAGAGDTFLDLLRAAVSHFVGASERNLPELDVAHVTDGAVVGAATLALQEFFRAPLDAQRPDGDRRAG